MSRTALVLMLALPPAGSIRGGQDGGAALPTIGLGTVLVYRSSLEHGGDLVVRVAEFLPNRFVEWEDSTTQGTIYLTSKAVAEAREYVSWGLFQSGVDTKGTNKTTLWLSGRMFRELGTGKKVKITIDGISTAVWVLGKDHMEIEVNRSTRSLPVIKTRDDRGNERWFLDAEENPMLVNHVFQSYQQKLVSITTDRANTLRWIRRKTGLPVR